MTDPGPLYLPRVVRDGGRVLKFDAVVLGAATSERAGAPRWSELVVYLLRDGRYIISKVGRSSIAHRDTCPRVTWRMPHWIDAPSDEQGRRTACPECQPLIYRDGIDPMLLVEVTRYSVLMAEDADGLRDVLTGGRENLPQLVKAVIAQVAAKSPEFAASVHV
jgi:hypothetical protein